MKSIYFCFSIFTGASCDTCQNQKCETGTLCTKRKKGICKWIFRVGLEAFKCSVSAISFGRCNSWKMVWFTSIVHVHVCLFYLWESCCSNYYGTMYAWCFFQKSCQQTSSTVYVDDYQSCSLKVKCFPLNLCIDSIPRGRGHHWGCGRRSL